VEVTGLCRTDLKIISHGHRDLVLQRIPGEEVVGAVISNDETKVKSFVSVECLFPKVALVDPASSMLPVFPPRRQLRLRSSRSLLH
jgi:hypothetical protein